jgi:hypothetical protein
MRFIVTPSPTLTTEGYRQARCGSWFSYAAARPASYPCSKGGIDKRCYGLEAPRGRSSRRASSADWITSIGVQYDGLHFCALQPRFTTARPAIRQSSRFAGGLRWVSGPVSPYEFVFALALPKLRISRNYRRIPPVIAFGTASRNRIGFKGRCRNHFPARSVPTVMGPMANLCI